VSSGAGQLPGHEDIERAARLRRKRATKGLVFLVLVAVAAVFVIQNSQRVRVHFWFVTGNPRLIWVILACLVVGIAFGYVLGRRRRGRRRDQHQGKSPRPRAGDAAR
jgi:lipopolysaccharide assembly protein A